MLDKKRHVLNILVLFFPSINISINFPSSKSSYSVMYLNFSPSKKCLYFYGFLGLFYQVYTYWIKVINNISLNNNLYLSLEVGL